MNRTSAPATPGKRVVSISDMGCESPAFFHHALVVDAVTRLSRKQENPVQLRARASSSPVAEQRGARLLSGSTPVRLRAGGSGPLIYAAKSLAFQAGEPGANPGRVIATNTSPPIALCSKGLVSQARQPGASPGWVIPGPVAQQQSSWLLTKRLGVQIPPGSFQGRPS